MKRSNPESIPSTTRVFVACLLSFAILITPIAAIAAPRAGINPVKEKAAPAERKEASNATVTSNLAPAPVPAPAPAAPIIVATMTDNRPSVDPASAKPGDTINYTVTIQNTGDADATGVQFNDDVDVHTAYVNGSGLLAMADGYNTIGEVQISVPAPGVLTNDLDITAGNNTGMTATAQTVSSAQCAACNNVTINADGSFTYDPKVGFTGTDSFTYTAKNAANKTASATVQITVTGRIWFINNNAGACTSNCDGRLSHPFQTLAAFQAVNNGGANHPAAGDSIFIYESATDYVGPVTLLDNQKFFGQDAKATLISLTGLTQPSGTDPLPAMAAANGTIVNITSAGIGITLSNGPLGNTLRGFTVGNTTGAKISGNSFSNLTVGNNLTPDVTLTGNGQALNLTTGAFTATSGFVSVATTSSTAQGISLASVIGGPISFGSTTVSGSTSDCISLSNGSNVDINFGNTSCTGGTNGVNFQNNSAGTRTFGTLNVSGGSGNAFLHGTGGGNVTVTGAATLSSAGTAVSISAPTATDVINFQAATSATSSGAGNTGVNWVGTAGASLTFSALTVQTNAGTGLNATTGGTVTVTNGTGTINNTVQAAAAIIANSVALNANFSAIKSSGGTNGLSLTTVTGTSTFGSNSTLSGASGATFLVSGGTTTVTYSGSITQANNAAMVSIAGGHNTGTISFDTGALSATNGTGLQFNNADGTYNFHTASGSTTLNGGDAGIDITNGSGGSFTFGKSGTPASFVITKGNAGNAFDVDGSVLAVTAGVAYNGNITQSNTGAMVNVIAHSTGTITFQASGTLSATNGTGLQFSNADGTYNFNGTTTLNGGDAGIDILNGSAGTFAFGGTTITNPTGVAVNVDGTAAANTGGITISGTISKTSAGKLIDFFNYDTGTATFSGNLSCITSCQGVEVTNNGSAGTVNFSGGTKTLTTGASTAINLDTNTGGSVNFTGGGLAISTTSGVGLNAIGGGVVTVTTGGTDNTVSTATGTGINIITPANIGGGGVTFKSVTVNNGASNSATNAIVLNGTTGNFTVSGDGSTGSGMCGGGVNATAGLLDCDGSGGTINKTTGISVLLTNATNVTLRQMNITSPALDGIKANGGSALTFSAIFVNTPGASNPGAGGDGFGTGNGIRAENVTGTNSIDNNTRVTNWQALVSNAVLLHQVGTNFTSFTFKDSKIDTSATGSAGFNGNINTATTGTINILHNEFTLIDQNAVQILNNGSGTLTSIVQKNNFHDADNTSGDGNNTFFLALAGSGQNNFTIGGPLAADGNTFNNLARLITLAGVLQIDCAGVNTGGARLNGTIQNNTIGNNGGFVNGRRAIDIQLEADAGASQGAHSVLIANNTINNIDKQGINMTLVTTGGGDIQNGNYTIKNNTLTNVGTEGNVDSGSGIEIESNADVANVGSNVSGNFLIQSNSVQNSNNSAVGTALEINNRPFGGNNTSVFNLTILGNTITNSNAAGEVFEIVNSAGDGSALPNTCLDLNSGNTSANNAVGGNGTGFKLTNNAGTFAIEGLGAATPSAFLGPKNQSNGVSPATITSVGAFVNSAGCANSTAMFMAPPAANQNLFASVDLSKATIDGTAAVHTETNSSIARADLAKATVDATATAHTEAVANTRTASASFGTLISSAAHSLATMAGKVDALVVPTAYAGNEEGNQKSGVSNQKSDVKLNHAAGRRTAKSATTNSALAPVGCSANPGTVCVNVGTLKPGDSVQISFSVTVNNPPNLSLLTPPHVTTQGAVSGGNFATVPTNDPDTVAAGDTTDTPIDLFDVNVGLGSSLNPSTATDPVTYTATITVDTSVQTPPGGTNPTGSVTFKDNNVAIGTCTNVAISGAGPWTAQCTIAGGTYVGGSSHPITATYNGDGNFDTKTSSTLTQTVQNCQPTATVTNTGDNGGVDPAIGAGTGTLRQAIVDVCNGGTINFNIAGGGPDTIALSAGLVLSKNVTINGPTNKSTIVDGGGTTRVFTVNSGKTVSISDLTVNNGFSAGNGGGILNDHGTLTLTNMTISGSTALLGGGVYNNGNAGTASLTITNSTISGNTGTTNGGGIYNDGNAAGTAVLALINSTISTNKTNGQGGGIFIAGAGASTTLTTTNVTITNNTADFDDSSVSDNGGGLFIGTGPVVALRNTIVAGNFRGTASPVADDIQGANVDTTAASSNNLIGTGGSGGLTAINGNQINVASPGLGPLANNGGPTLTHKLLPTSLAIEAGDNTFSDALSLTTDQRGTGFPRKADSADADTTATVDIGAYELHPSIEDITDKTTAEDTALPGFVFNLGDGTGALIASVTASSSNTTLVPNDVAHLTITGAGSTRTLAITPAADANSPADGTATITVTVTATNGQTAQDTFVLTVTEVNDAPVPVNDTVSDIDEDSGVYSIPKAALVANDAKGPANEAGQTLSITGVSNFTGGTAVLNGANIDFTPTADFNGAAGFDYTVQDDGTTNGLADFKSATGHVSFNINPINDPPSFTKGADQTINKNAGAQSVPNWATAISPGPADEGSAGQTVSFNVSVTGTTGNLAFTVAPAVSSTGTLTYTATNGTSGTADVSVTAVDSGLGAPPPNSNTSAAQTFTITVTAVNQAPVNTVPASVSIPQDTVYTFTGGVVSVADSDAAETDNVISVALTSTNGTMNLSGVVGLNFTSGANGTAAMTFEGTIPDLNTALNNMTFTPTAGYTGAASIQMVSNDLGKTGTGGPQSDTDTINITVTAGAGIFINEILFNPPGADAPNEYIELRGPANTVVPTGTYLVAVEGDAADNPGDVQTIINLSGLSFGSNGFLVLLQNGNTYTTQAGATVVTSTTAGFGGLPGGIFQADGGVTDIEDASATFMLVQTAVAPTLTDDVDVNNDGTPDGAVFAGWNVRDSIGVLDGTDTGDRAYGAINFSNNTGTNGTATGTTVLTTFTAGYVGRIGDSTGSTAADWVASGALGGAAPNWTLGVAAQTEPAAFAGKALNHIGASNFANLAPVNSVPAAQNVNEDFTLTFNAGNANLISISDPDAGGADMKVTLTATNGTMSLSGTAGLTFTPPGPGNDGTNDTQMIFTGTIANINAALNGMTFTPPGNFFSPPDGSITILTEDQGNTGVGGNQTDSDTVNITVNPINDPPSFVKGANQTVNEDAGPQTVVGWATSMSQGPGESGQTLTFNVSVNGTTGNLAFSSAPAINASTGTLTYTTSADTNGTATIDVSLSDNGSNVAPNSNTSGVQQFTITVNAINDAPTFQIVSNPPAVNEDAGAQTVNSFATNFQPGPAAATDESVQTLVGYTLTANGTTGNLAFTSGPAINNAGQLTYTTTADTFGTATFNVVATDSGSGVAPNVNQSAPVSFTITVNSSNDPPTFTKGPDQTTFQNSGPQTVTNWATNMSPGPADEAGQTLTFNVTGNTNAGMFSAGPAIDATTGTLTYTGANNASGNATITITLSDNGGTANGGNDTSAPKTFVITINPCANPVTVTSTNDSGAGSLRSAIVNVCVGGTINFDPALNGQTITLTTGELLINKNVTISGPGANLLTVSGNNASRVFNIQAGMTSAVSGLTITGGSGGGVFNAGTLTLTNCAVTGNTGGSGGGVTNAGGATMTVTGSTISGNTAPQGAGILNASTLTLINSTLSGNTGDGLSNASGAVANLTNDTFSGNSVRGITSNPGATTNIRNSIVVNTPGAFGDVQGNFISQGNNLIGKSDGSAGFTNGVNNDQVGTIATPLNALLAVLGNYGGPTQTHALLPGSTAINAGSNCVTDVAHCGDASIPQLTTDQRSFARQVNGTVDIGAVESRGFTIAATSGTPQSAPISTAFGAPLLATVSSAFGEPVSGGQVTFTAPGAGASATFTGGVTTLIVALNGSGQASASATANGTAGGPYNVTSASNGITGAANFSLTNAKGNQTITFGAIATKTFGDPDFGVSPTASSGLAVSLVASGDCTVSSPSPGTVHINGAGSCTITASQTGDANYNAATNVPQSFTINKANQTITFNALANRTFGDPDFAVNATASSGLPVGLVASGNCTVSTPAPGTVHLNGAGSCTITASQAGDANYNAATNVPQSFTIAKAATNTAVLSNFNPSDLNQNVTFRAEVTSVGPKTGTVQFKDNGNNLGAPAALDSLGVALLTTSSLTAGTHTITADYSGDANFLASSGTLSGGQVVRAQPSLSINDVSVTEGDVGTKVLTFTITLSAGSNLPVSVDYATANGTATAGPDYVAANGTFTFNPLDGDVTRTLNVTINGDVGFEPDETFVVNLSNPVNATISDNQGTGTIQNDDVLGGFISFSQANTSVNESTGIVTLTVVRSNDVSQAVNIDYATDDTGASTNCAALNTGLASQRCDYTSVFGTLRFAANETQKTIDIPINLDAYTEGPEIFSVKLSNPTGGAVLAVPSTGVVTINDSASPAPNAIDDTTTFVRQQYRDFLNRDADAAGLAFWKNNIDKCNDPAQRAPGQTLAACIEVQRIVTSAAFFLSIEFKQTGGLVREFYVAALDRPASNNMPTFVEFMRDAQGIQKGVVVGQGNWQQVLDANRTAFMNEFVTRAEFVALYPTTDTPTQYVDKLYQHAAVAPVTIQERLDAIQEFGGAPTAADPGARGRALQRITLNGNFQAREANRTFVQIEYFGYLRRDPDIAGFNFWVAKMNQFNGDFLQAEMVKAFLSSIEYRGRFGP